MRLKPLAAALFHAGLLTPGEPAYGRYNFNFTPELFLVTFGEFMAHGSPAR